MSKWSISGVLFNLIALILLKMGTNRITNHNLGEYNEVEKGVPGI